MLKSEKYLSSMAQGKKHQVLKIQRECSGLLSGIKPGMSACSHITITLSPPLGFGCLLLQGSLPFFFS